MTSGYEDYEDDEYDDERTLLEQVEKLQAAYIAGATQDAGGLDAATFGRLRKELLTAPACKDRLPDFVRKYRDQGQFWQFIKGKYSTYKERRVFIWDEFRPLIQHLEFEERAPGIAPISNALERFEPDNVHGIWQKALDRRETDPEGAITAARTLLETVCKHGHHRRAVPSRSLSSARECPKSPWISGIFR